MISVWMYDRDGGRGEVTEVLNSGKVGCRQLGSKPELEDSPSRHVMWVGKLL